MSDRDADADAARSSQVPSSPLVRTAARGVSWMTLAYGTLAIGSAAQALVLARILTPAQFGVVSAALVVMGLGQQLADGGLSYAILRERDPAPDVLSSLYWANVASSIAVGVVTFATADLVASAFRLPDLAGLLRAGAIVFLIVPWGSQFQLMLQRAMRFRLIAVNQTIGVVVGVVVSVVAALLGAGSYAPIYGYIVTFALQAVVYTFVGWTTWPPRRRFRLRHMRGYLRFGVFQLGDRVLGQLGGNVDYILVGAFLGPAALGYYSIAYQIVVRPLVYLNPILLRVTFPVFTLRQDDNPSLARGYVHVERILGYVAFPLLAGIAALAPTLVPLVFGDAWHDTIAILQVLCILGAARCIYNPAGAIVLTKGHANLSFYLNLVALAVMSVVLLGAAQLDLQAVAWAEAAVVCGQCLLWWGVLRRTIDLSLRRNLTALANPAAISIAAGAGGWLAGVACDALGAATVVQAAAVATCGLALYAALVACTARDYVTSIVGLLRDQRERAAV
jgi:O-antigen/teichoic acid export membrane protein